MRKRLELEVAALWAALVLVAVVLARVTGDSAGSGQLVGAVGAVVTGWYVSRRRRKARALERARAAELRAMRPCPTCKGNMRRERDTCSRCGARSTPWIRQGGLWWALDGDGRWQRWNEAAGRFEPYRPPDHMPASAAVPNEGRDAELEH